MRRLTDYHGQRSLCHPTSSHRAAQRVPTVGFVFRNRAKYRASCCGHSHSSQSGQGGPMFYPVGVNLDRESILDT